MKYESILERLENEKKDKALSAKLYRYTGLMQAIEFFSQKLVFEQIIDAAFDFINELLLVEKSAIYVLEKDLYISKKTKGYCTVFPSINNTDNLKNLATLYGNILYEKDKISKFFDQEFIDAIEEPDAIVPLIIDGNLYGFIIINNKSFGEDDYIISEALMRLINNALENYSRYEKLIKTNSALDEKIFNLFAINQSSKVLLSELRIDVLFKISVDVFSELTRSKITGFVLYDEKYDKYKLKGYRDVFYNLKDFNIDLALNKINGVNPNKVIIDLNNEVDRAYFDSIFTGYNKELRPLEPKYVVLILKNNTILGFVTLSDTVTGDSYGNGIFELIESLAASTYIALSNAKLFKEVNDQKLIIQKKLDNLICLNTLTKNISSSIKVQNLLDITAKTLEISFNVEKGAICLYNKETQNFEVSKTIGFECKDLSIITNQKWKRVFEGDSIYAIGQERCCEYIGNNVVEKVGDSQGILVIPIYIDMMEIEMLGTIIVFKYKNLQLDNEENMLTIETIAGHIAPVLNNLTIIQMQQRFMLPNFIELFKHDLKEEISAAINYDINLSVLQVQDVREFVFKGNCIIDILKSNFKKVYPFSYNNIFIIENDDNNEIEVKIKEYTDLENLKIKKMVLGKDFKNFADFFDIFR